jgi:hypothetical protein
VSQAITRSVPPYSLGGTLSVRGAISPIRIELNSYTDARYARAVLAFNSAPLGSVQAKERKAQPLKLCHPERATLLFVLASYSLPQLSRFIGIAQPQDELRKRR